MIRPALKDDAFLADVACVRTAPGPTNRPQPPTLWWLGQSGFLLHWAGRFVLLDPYLSDSLTRKYAATDKPHVRMSERVIAPERLDFVDVVTSSHNHTDHLDPETLLPLAAANPSLTMICPEANRAVVRERSGLPDERIVGLSCDSHQSHELANGCLGRARTPLRAGPSPRKAPAAPTEWSPCLSGETSRLGASIPQAEIDPGQNPPTPSRFELPGSDIAFRAIPAAHETLDRDHAGRLIYLGFVVELGPYRIYHSGDTVLFDGMASLLAGSGVDVALLPINGRAPERRVTGNLRGREAARLAKQMGARLVVPCHYDMFEFNTASPDEFVATCREIDQPQVVLEQGARLTLTPRE